VKNNGRASLAEWRRGDRAAILAACRENIKRSYRKKETALTAAIEKRGKGGGTGARPRGKKEVLISSGKIV